MCYRFIQRQSSGAGEDSIDRSAGQREMASPAEAAPARKQVATAYERFMADIKRWSGRQDEHTTKP